MKSKERDASGSGVDICVILVGVWFAKKKGAGVFGDINCSRQVAPLIYILEFKGGKLGTDHHWNRGAENRSIWLYRDEATMVQQHPCSCGGACLSPPGVDTYR